MLCMPELMVCMDRLMKQANSVDSILKLTSSISCQDTDWKSNIQECIRGLRNVCESVNKVM
jgi:hypothetical protein